MPPIGDLLYPDNPKRRARAAQLANDIKSFAIQFDAVKKQRDMTVLKLKPKLEKLLHQHGLLDPSEIERRIAASLSSGELQKYYDLKQRISIVDDVETIIMGLIDFVAVTAGVVIGTGFLVGIAGAGAALATVGEVVAAVAVLVALASVFEASQERSELRGCIVDLFKKRVHLRIILGQMEAIAHWLGHIEVWLDNLESNHHEVLDKLVSQTLASEYNKWTVEFAEQELVKFDDSRESWRDEDHWAESLGVLLRAAPTLSPFGSKGPL